MNQQDLAELTKKWQLETSCLNASVDEALKLSQDHAYALGLKRGRADCLKFVNLLIECHRFGSGIAKDYLPSDLLEKVRFAIAKFQGENHE